MKLPNSLKKINRSQAFDISRKLVHQETVSHDEILALMMHFAPNLSVNPKTSEQWIALAVAKNDVRYYLNHLYSDGEFLYGTNGHRLFWNKTDLPMGFYNPKTMDQVNEDARFPDCSRVMLKDTCSIDMKYSELEKFIDDTGSKPVTRVKIGDAWFQESVIKACFIDDQATITAMPENSEKPIQGFNTFGKFVAMPFITK